MKDVNTVITEIKGTVKKHPEIKKIAFGDDNVLFYKETISNFLHRYKEEIGLPFRCSCSPMLFSLSKGRLLKEAGCVDVSFGIESGSERIKNNILRRPMSNASIIKAFKIIEELDIMSSSFNMIGLPTETKDEVFATLKLNAAIRPDCIKMMTFYPFENTPIYDLCLKKEMIDHDKKKQLDNYQTFTCLKFPPEYQLFLKKVQAIFNWYINISLNNETSSQYQKLVDEVEAMSEEVFDDFDFGAVDQDISHRFRRKGFLHYTNFMNRSLAVKFPSKHFN